jgi:hypothetical protein
MSRWPACRAVSSIRCRRIHRRLTSPRRASVEGLVGVRHELPGPIVGPTVVPRSLSEELVEPAHLDPAEVFEQTADGGEGGDEPPTCVGLGEPGDRAHDHLAVAVEEDLERSTLGGGGRLVGRGHGSVHAVRPLAPAADRRRMLPPSPPAVGSVTVVR